MKRLLYYPLCAILCVSMVSAALPINVIAEEIQPQEAATGQVDSSASGASASAQSYDANPGEINNELGSGESDSTNPAFTQSVSQPSLTSEMSIDAEQAAMPATSGYQHSDSATSGNVTLTVEWNDPVLGQPTTFHVSATGGSGAYQYRMDAPSYSSPNENSYEAVADPTRGEWLTYTQECMSNDFEFTMKASGTYNFRFYLMDKPSGVYYMRTSTYIQVSDDTHPSVSSIVNNAVNLAKTNTDGSEYAMALYLHDWLLDRLEYDHSLQYSSAESALTRGLGTCQAYESAYSKLLTAAGIENEETRSTGDGHTWNAMKIDGQWCQVDCTWDDTSKNYYGDLDQRHLYFGLSDELMLIAHSKWKNSTNSTYGKHETSLANNYFVRNGKADEWAGEYAVRIQEHLNAKETSFSINADNQLDPPSISGIQNGIVAYAMNQRNWTANNKKVNLNAVSNVTMTSNSTWTTKCDFTAEYTNQQAAVTEKLDVARFKGTSDPSAWTAPARDGYAFAGWYSDEACKQVYTGTSGQAYARFVPVSGLIRFQGCSLRNDGEGADVANLRFGYEFTIPSGSTLKRMGWYCYTPSSAEPHDVAAKNYWLAGGGSARSNIVLTGIKRSGSSTSTFSSTFSLLGRVSYVTADGTSVEAAEPERRSATVNDVASAIVAGGMGSSADKAYAKQIIGSKTPSSQPESGLTDATVEQLDVSNYKGTSAWTAPARDGYAFAGWYSDEACKQVYTGTSGQAYARFVPVSGLIRFQGCSLRNDGEGADVANLRFGYEFTIPSGSTLKKMGWDCYTPSSNEPRDVAAKNYWLAGGGSARSNIVLTGIRRSGSGTSSFSSTFSLLGRVSYVTADGTSVEAAEPERRSATVNDVASAIVAGGMGSSADKAYASAIIR